jgi:hypothetical protein
MHDISSAGQRGVVGTLAKALDILWWKRFRQDVKDFGERCVVCRRAKIQPLMVATLYPSPIPPIPWHTTRPDYYIHSHVSNGFDNLLIVVDHLSRMAHFLPCTRRVTLEETPGLFLHGVFKLHGLPRVSVFATQNSPADSVTHCGDTLERGSTCLPADTHRPTTLKKASTSRFSNFCDDFAAATDQSGRIYCLTWNSRTTPLVRSESSTPTLRRNLAFLLKSHLACCSQCDLRFQFRKTLRSDLNNYMRFMLWYVRCYICTRTECKLAQNRRQHRTSFDETRCQSLQGVSSCEECLTVSCVIDNLVLLHLRSRLGNKVTNCGGQRQFVYTRCFTSTIYNPAL